MNKYWRYGLTAILFVAIFLFWKFGYPQAMSYQEQNQLFLFTADYFLADVRIAGGLATYIGEFLVQFYYVEWLGALILALLYVALQQLSWAYLRSVTSRRQTLWYVVSFLPPLLLLGMMGDYNLLLSFPVAVLMSLALTMVMRRRCMWADIIVVPLAYWLIGSAVWIYVILRIIQCSTQEWKRLWLAPYLLALQLLSACTVLAQWHTVQVLAGINYHRVPIIYKQNTFGYDRDLYEVLRQDYLVRNERWDEVISRAERYQPKAAFSSVCVNLALAKKRQLADRMFSFYQSGRDALIMGIYRDNTSDLPSMEAFWHLGMINSCLRYAFDLQEAIINGKRSGRLTKRLAECYMINGNYAVAQKHINLLKKTLFYRQWAIDFEKISRSNTAINSHPVYGRKRQFRFKEDFLYNYNEIDKVFGRLFVNNPENTMALDYFMAQMLLRGRIAEFTRYMSWVEQYGQYKQMPRGYQDALRCIQAGGALEDSDYGRYVEHMRKTGRIKSNGQ